MHFSARPSPHSIMYVVITTVYIRLQAKQSAFVRHCLLRELGVGTLRAKDT